MKKPRQTYETRAALFAAACDIGYDILAKADIPDEEKQRELRIILSDKHSALNPPPQFKRIDSLKCLEAEHFWYWNEKTGPHIREYWKAIANAGLPFKGKDIIAMVLKRGRVKDIHEFDFLKDELFAAEQIGRISNPEAEIIKAAMVKFECRKKREGS